MKSQFMTHPEMGFPSLVKASAELPAFLASRTRSSPTIHRKADFLVLDSQPSMMHSDVPSRNLSWSNTGLRAVLTAR